ncbi:hypothetical protein F4693_003539 [Sphingomonas endophytica]|uniref:Uncharacterized protein n=1 Tax=Sphingomonas endophytica TaxID=869719 RepID=A0A7X0MPS8_9SPHN|nr:hypothetical protein [Sphingomonas endophytica]MBB6506536.1 hypothetical protein [Sphingomonas endophytica]
MTHDKASPLAGTTVRILSGPLAGKEIEIEDWWDRIAGRSWVHCNGNPACLIYAMESFGDPLDDEVLYGKIGVAGHLIHVTRVQEA